jgi:hypothetical protein
MKKTFVEQHTDFEKSVSLAIKLAVLKSRTISEHSNTIVIKIKDENIQFNLSGNRYLTEISHNNLIDESGYEYGFDVLSLDELCQIADYCTSKSWQLLSK